MKRTNQNPIICARFATSLGMSKSSDTSVKAQTIRQYILNVVCTNRFQVLVVRAFSDNNEGFSFAHFSVLIKLISL